MPSRQEKMAFDLENGHGHGHAHISQPSPSPTATPYRTPPASMSRQSLSKEELSPGPSPSSSPFSPEQPDVEQQRNMLDAGEKDDSISPLDPRRFTPTLHASLVGEILSLRRDLENKVEEMDNLEVSLDHTKTESDEFQETLAKTARENRSLKRQLQLLEGGSLNAVTELAKERDEALESISDTRKRLEQSQKKVRAQEEQIHLTQTQVEDERQKWDEERRNLDRKVHVVEGRLKIVLNEVAAAQASNSPSQNTPAADVVDDDATRDTPSSVHGTPNRSGSVLGRRRPSTASSTQEPEFPSNRLSMMSMANGHSAKGQGLSLADELAFDEEEEYDDDYQVERSDSRATFTKERPSSTHSHRVGKMARRALHYSLDGVDRPETPKDAASTAVPQTPPPPRFEYRDTGIQYTPPPSPPFVARENNASGASNRPEEADAPDNDIPYQSVDSGINTENIDMVSSACQTAGEPSPPITPSEEMASRLPEAEPVQTTTTSTQTDELPPAEETQPEPEPEPEPQPEPEVPISIPTISIEPPGSNPPSPRTSVVLPPRTKSAGCQTDKEPSPNVRSWSVQTEEIRIDKRPINLANSLLPSAIQDQPSNNGAANIDDFPTPIPPYCPPPPRSAKRKAPPPPHPTVDPPPPPPPQSPPPEPPEPQKDEKGKEPETIQAYPGNNDNGPLAETSEQSEIRRPLRTSSLFAGFEQSSDDEQSREKEGERGGDPFSDEELTHRPLASYTLRYGKMVSKQLAPATILDEPKEEEEAEQQQQSPTSTAPSSGSNARLQRSTATSKPPGKRPPRLKQPDIRRHAMISSSSAAHQSRPRSPSAPSISSSSANHPPPFPVPVRLSSRKVPISSSEGAQSPTPYGDGSFPEAMNASSSSGKEPLRKVRSDVAVPKMHRRRSESPPTISTSSAAPDSPQAAAPPPMPFDDITAREKKRTGRPRKDHHTAAAAPKEDATVAEHTRDNSTATSVQQTSVVDAIAQTMIGEWMWKYVRRRRSFGVPDSARDQWEMGKSTEEVSANISGSGTRHQRWVWIAPYERAVMWSSKQPVSGSALLGKTGRKLVIQSVLDVKDDNPLPKGTSPQNNFGRSILILTPQRALKFTALTVERHFVWLTALSFLSHSSMDINDLASLPPVPQEESTQPPPPPALRRNPIRDSIRVAKGNKSRWNKPFASQTPAVPEIPGDMAYDANPVADAADPPNIPRYHHTRKRSNTAPRGPAPPPSSFRSFSNNAAPSTHSATTAGSSDLYSPTSIGPAGGGTTTNSGQSSHRTSEASGGQFRGPGQIPAGVAPANFFDAVGTVRMEAFVDRAAEIPPPPPPQRTRKARGSRRTRHGGKRREQNSNQHYGYGNGYWPQSPETDFPRSEDGSDILFRHDDPFRGF